MARLSPATPPSACAPSSSPTPRARCAAPSITPTWPTRPRSTPPARRPGPGRHRAQAALQQLAREQGEAQAAQAGATAQLAALESELGAQREGRRSPAGRLGATRCTPSCTANPKPRCPPGSPPPGGNRRRARRPLAHRGRLARQPAPARRGPAGLDAAVRQLAEAGARLTQLELTQQGARQSLQEADARLAGLSSSSANSWTPSTQPLEPAGARPGAPTRPASRLPA